MPRINEAWGRAIRELLEKHGLTLRAAMLRAGGEPSHATIKDWTDNIEPSDLNKAYKFLAAFPRDEALNTLNQAGLPIPQTLLRATDPVEAVDIALRSTRLSEDAQRQIREFAEEIKRKYPINAEAQ